MALHFEDLPLWEFTVEEISPGVYRLEAVRGGGITGGGSGTDSDALLAEFRAWALKVESDLKQRTQELKPE